MQTKPRAYGLSYKGSKSKLAERIVGLLPRAAKFYDLFAGGCAITHCALLKNKFQHIHINDINPMMPQAFVKALQGGFDNEDRWISREDFFRLKDTDPYVAICFSFGNNLRTYCYNKEIEPIKKALHYAIFFDSYDLSDKLIGVDLRPIQKCATRQEKYLMAKCLIKGAYLNGDILYKGREMPKDLIEPRLQSYERQDRMQGMIQKKRCGSTCRTGKGSTDVSLSLSLYDEQVREQERLLKFTSASNPNKTCSLTWSIGDYQDVEIEDNSVIYCDIPYIGTDGYTNGGEGFDHERFYDWCLRQKQPLYISSYKMPEKDFKVVAEFLRVDTFSPAASNNVVAEKLFMPRTQETKGNIQLSLF